ncbi:putative fructose-2,6-bisphosphatase TIGAR A [Oryzias melastigma]|uniref:fructose-2,6-bisphosphate 2-phosphatase n=1 Tax=Oryzias melastigma TaxID=30732 RepID=A0A3B3CPL3_ORYME|nr:probable fructose-2,6-bisphosphatase TIGAR A [Oryzias melastigma]KAF6738017.1 putative fructose-2,6-bisphosphatase TIGAR A [Oryzias melastigma]
MSGPAVRNQRSMKMLTFGLTLVRHGETQCNKEGRLQGQAIDAPLSETGLQQAEAAGRYLKDVKFSHVFASDMLRAKQTAETIMQLNSSCSGLRLTLDSLLKEKNFGVAEGGRVQEFKDMAKAAGKSFMDFTPPQGETQEQVKERVKRFLEKTLQRIGAECWHGGELDDTSTPAEAPPAEGKADDGVGDTALHALVVTHGVYMYVALRYFMEELVCGVPRGCDPALWRSLSPNAGMSRFRVSARKDGERFVLSRICCVFLHRQDHVRDLH